MTTFRSAIGVCGLSQQEAADFLDVSLDSVKAWCSGRRSVPEGAWKLLASLFEQVQDASEACADHLTINGIDPRSYNDIQTEIPGRELPTTGASKAAGAMALLMTIQSHVRVDDE